MKVRLLNKLPLKTGYTGELSSLRMKLRDKDGDIIAIYKDGYHRLSDELKMALSLERSNERKIRILKDSGFNVVKYFHPINLQNYRVTNIQSIDQIPGIKPDETQNCVVVNGGNVYVHPKVKSAPSTTGVNHSSLSFGRGVDFAGSLVKRNDRWVLNNTTGHYGTRPSKIIACLQAFIKNKISIENLDVEHWILIDASKPDDNASYQIETLPAVTLLARMDRLVVSKKTSPLSEDPGSNKESLSTERKI